MTMAESSMSDRRGYEVVRNKAKSMLLTYQEETKQPRHLIPGLPCSLSSLHHWKVAPIFKRDLTLA